MRIGGTLPSAIAPVSGAGHARRDKSGLSDPRAGSADDTAAHRPGRALVPVGRASTEAPRARAGDTAAVSLLNAQIIAQGLPAKSERRLARYFPDRAVAAYQHHAALLDDAGRKRVRRSA